MVRSQCVLVFSLWRERMLIQRMYVQDCEDSPGQCLIVRASQLQDDGRNMECTMHLIYDLPFGLGGWFLRRLARRNATVKNATFLADVDYHAEHKKDCRG